MSTFHFMFMLWVIALCMITAAGMAGIARQLVRQEEEQHPHDSCDGARCPNAVDLPVAKVIK